MDHGVRYFRGQFNSKSWIYGRDVRILNYAASCAETALISTVFMCRKEMSDEYFRGLADGDRIAREAIEEGERRDPFWGNVIVITAAIAVSQAFDYFGVSTFWSVSIAVAVVAALWAFKGG